MKMNWIELGIGFIGIFFLGWFAASYIEIVSQNLDHNAALSFWNLFEITIN